MNDYTATIHMLTCKYIEFKECAANETDKNLKMFYENLVKTREQLLIDLANKIIKENEKRYRIY